jgi:hypothetical protein
MNSRTSLAIVLLMTGFCAGLLAANLPHAVASDSTPGTGLAGRTFAVSVDEIRQNLVFAKKFRGHYATTVTLSDGTLRTIELTPMVHDGIEVVEIKDSGSRSYMGLDGTTTNGQLMVQVRDMDTLNARLRQQGWPRSR